MPTLSIKAKELHRDALVVDLHADTFELVHLGYDFFQQHSSYALLGHVLGHVDMPRLQKGAVDAQCFGIVIPPWASGTSALAKVKRQLTLMEETCQASSGQLIRARSAPEVRGAHQKGKVAALAGVEGSYGLAEIEDAVETMASGRVLYWGLAHLAPHGIAPSSLWHRKPRGLHPRAAEVMAQLEEHGIVVDLAHLAREPFVDACARARKPVVVSHTGLAVYQPMWRNIDDNQIRAVADTGGVIGIIMTPRYLGIVGADGVAAHINHVRKVGGEDCPALGSDFDGLVRPPSDVKDASGLATITDAMLRQGMDERAVRKALGLNVIRLLEEVPPHETKQGV